MLFSMVSFVMLGNICFDMQLLLQHVFVSAVEKNLSVAL